jgi:hypothetical protein
MGKRRRLEDFIAGYRQEVVDPRITRIPASDSYKDGREQAMVDLGDRAVLIEDHRDLGGLYSLSAYQPCGRGDRSDG